MEIVRGVAQRLQLGTEVVGNNDQVSTSHVATLQIERLPIRMEMPQAIMLREGDRLEVAGVKGRDGVFAAYAYRNLETGARGTATGLGALIAGAVALLVGVGAGLVVAASLLGAFGDGMGSRLGVAAFASIFMIAFGRGGALTLQLFSRTKRAQAALA